MEPRSEMMMMIMIVMGHECEKGTIYLEGDQREGATERKGY
jgi:hypothetical protein